MLVTYTYRSDATAAATEDSQSPSKDAAPSEVKTFSFYTAVDLGPIGSRVDATRVDDPRA